MSPGTDAAWTVIRAAADAADAFDRADRLVRVGLAGDGTLSADAPERPLEWRPGSGWQAVVAEDDPRRTSFDLYLPICSATDTRPIVVGHLGQSLDGFIATHSGDSQFVTGSANIVHLHRLRALCDAVIVGSGTVAADDPQLTTRYVTGPNPLRVVYDPTRRLDDRYRLFTDEAAPTVYLCAAALVSPGEARLGSADVTPLEASEPRSEEALTEVLTLLRARGCRRIFVEGGGVTVSAFLQVGLLDRLHVAIAPLIIGDGRPAIRLTPQTKLRDCRRPLHRVFRMGDDILFDCDLHAEAPDAGHEQHLARII